LVALPSAVLLGSPCRDKIESLGPFGSETRGNYYLARGVFFSARTTRQPSLDFLKSVAHHHAGHFIVVPTALGNGKRYIVGIFPLALDGDRTKNLRLASDCIFPIFPAIL